MTLDVGRRVRALAARVPPPRRRWTHTGGALAGWAYLVCAAGMVVSSLAEAVGGGGRLSGVLAAALLVGLIGAAALRWLRVAPEPTPTDLFGAVTLLWVAVSVAGAVPYVTTGTLGPYDALFESISGFTCTGSTTIGDLAVVDDGVLVWRQLTNWIGGLGLVVLAVSILPYLGVGGLSLMAAEAPGPGSDRMAPRLSAAARRLLAIYTALTILCALGLAIAGTGLADGVLFAMSAVSGGGFAPYNDSAGHFDSVAVELVLVAGMLAGATSFVLHWRAAHGAPGAYLRSTQMRTFLLIVGGVTLVAAAVEVASGAAVGGALRDSLFTVVTIAATCGLVNLRPGGGGDYSLWPAAAQLLLLIPFASGGMTGSTAGALKVLRLQVMAKVGRRELRRIVHPRAALPIVLDGRRVEEPIVSRVVAFVVWYFLVAVAGVIALSVFGVDLLTGMGSTLGAMGGSGLGLGTAGPTTNALIFDAPARGVLAVLMLAGRLEVFALVVVAAGVWRRARRLGGSAVGRVRPAPRSAVG